MWDEEVIPVPRDILLEEIRNVDGLYCLLTDNIDKKALDQAQKIKVIANMAVGYNNIDIEVATKRGIKVTNTPGVLIETTADLTFALLMATARRIVDASNFLQQGQWKTWSPMQLTGRDVFGATLGIVGLGRIGQAIVKRAQGFDMNVLYYNRSRKKSVESELKIKYSDLDFLLKKSDFVVILVPYSTKVHNLIGEKELTLMKKSAVLINTARGGIVNEQALYNALQNGEIWGAGLDVFENEPVSKDYRLLSLPNVVALPHIGSASMQTRRKMGHLAADNLINVLAGKEAVTAVN